jgi:rhamnosyltransferase
MKSEIVVICPTLNAGKYWRDWLIALKNQDLLDFITIIVDSGSEDDTVDLAKKYGCDVIEISSGDFDHGGTRNLAVNYAKEKYNCNIIIFLTQDAILYSKNSLKAIIEPLNHEKIGAVCGRQIPHKNADPIARHSRLFNYDNNSKENSQEDIPLRGLKTAYMSNSFAAYKYDIYKKCGGFPEKLIFGEDMYLAAKMILEGFKTYYAANANINHSHNYSLIEEFRRYFDIGVFHKNQNFLLVNFGKPHGEGYKYALSEFKYCYKSGIAWMFRSIFGTLAKFVGYKLGNKYYLIPKYLIIKFSMHSGYWINK